MPQFRYQALNADKQPVDGEVEADSVAQAVANLEAAGLTLLSIGFATSPARQAETSFTSPASPASRANSVERSVLERHLSLVVERGRALVPALSAYLAELRSAGDRRPLAAVIHALEREDTASAVAEIERLPAFWIPLLSAATATQDPGRMLNEFLRDLRQVENLRAQWRQTLAYPLLVVACACAVIVFLSIVVVPIFRDIFRGFGLRLPGLTQWVLDVADWISSGRILVAIALLVVVAVFVRQVRRRLPLTIQEFVDDPFVRLLGRPTAIAQFSQSLADLLEAQWSVPDALRLAGTITSSGRLRRAAWQLAGEMETPGQVDLSALPKITASVLHALRCDLPATSRIRLLRELSSCYAERAETLLSWSRGIVGPFCICLVGMVAGVTVIALFLPLISLIQGLS